jgi:CheY-like chemotaxis protein
VTPSVIPVLKAAPSLASKKKRVLLVDSSRITRDLRSETMRRLGAEVDCAADISEARCWWRADLYNLVLVNVPASHATTRKFCDDIRRFMPQQQIMFLVGKPDYLAAAPGIDQIAATDAEIDTPLLEDKTVEFASNRSSQHWGILEACRRISAVRSKMEARTQAKRDLPAPRRDSDSSRSRHGDQSENVPAIAELMEDPQ